jgi:hypothetical protein
VVVLALGLAPQQAGAYNHQVRAHQFNMCSTNDDCGSEGGAAAASLVAFFRGTDGPWSIAVQEACRHDIQSIANQTGYPGYMGVARNNSASCGDDYGNGIFRAGPYVAGSYESYQFPTQDVASCNINSHECRVGVCVTHATYNGNMNICSAHFDNDVGGGSQPIAYYQAGQYRVWAMVTYTSGGLILAGDFNLRPTQVPSTYNTYFKKAPSNWTWKSSDLQKQIDYVWHDHAHSDQDIPVAPYCSAYFSDHCYVFAKFD